MAAKRATVQDVASKAGVSISSVSRFLNGRLTLPPSTADRINRAVELLDYRPSEMARRMLRGRTDMIGFLTTDIAYPWFAAIASAAEAEARGHGYGLVIFNSGNDPQQELAALSKISDQQIDGLIVMTNHADDGKLAEAIKSAGKVVLVDEDVPHTSVPKVFAESKRGSELATRHLLEMGHRRIGFISGPRELISASERYAGFSEVLEGAGLAVNPDWVVFGEYDEAAGQQAFRHIWQGPERPTAIFAAADVLAIGVMRGAREAGIAIPRDLSLVGFDDAPHMDLLDPPLTTVRTSSELFGKMAAQMLISSLTENHFGPRAYRVEVELVKRGSVANLSAP